MKSKSFDNTRNLQKETDLEGHKMSMDFLDLYKTAAETSIILNDKRNLTDNDIKIKLIKNVKKDDKVLSLCESKKISNADLDISDDLDRNYNITSKNSKAASSSNNQDKSPVIKSIMKNSENVEEIMSHENSPSKLIRRKKRNKSVSFKVDENEEVVLKKSRSNESITNMVNAMEAIGKSPSTTYIMPEAAHSKSSIKQRKHKKNKIYKESISYEPKDINTSNDLEIVDGNRKTLKLHKSKYKNKLNPDTSMNISTETFAQEDHSKLEKKEKKKETLNEIQSTDAKRKRNKKHKTVTQILDEEPKPKSRKKDIKLISTNLENISIGDNANTLSNLLDDMSFVDKNKKNKFKKKNKLIQSSMSPSGSETTELEKIEEEKEKLKWNKRRWNRDKKSEVVYNGINTSVIVENLPLKIIMFYRKVLSDHFSTCGLIKKIGVAEVYPTEDPKPVFTTTIQFYSEDAATQALEEDNTELEGSRIFVMRPLPPTMTTVVVRSYAELSEQALSSAFLGCGRIRSIKNIVKGKKSIGTAFVEFDGPEAVERALKKAEDAKIGGKKMFVSRFEVRRGGRRDVETAPGPGPEQPSNVTMEQ